MAPDDEDRRPLSRAEASEQAPDGWRHVLDAIVARYETGDFTAGARFVQRIAELADAADHHPDVDLRYPHVTVRLASHDVDAITRRDTGLAAAIHAAADELGVAIGRAPDQVELGLDTADPTRLSPFYAALLGYAANGDDGLVDPAARGVPLWFQNSTSDAPDRQRWHVDVTVPHDLADERLRAVFDAGGTLVDDTHAPSFWVVADADGNRSCICTWQSRD